MHLFLAQSVNTITDLKTAVGKGLGVIIILGYLYAVILIISSLIAERGDGSWKYALAKGIALFGAVGICNILFGIFFPGQSIVPSFA